ncbi:hypothetical protein [Arenibaculum pallidiluteum]|uniref:hypothetical protein n=1 Tax=Arenibaculum pallidiluteum TaxID=2812559 RepID=UPI001A96972E|nr:hypothetical protein [Arenibaculum pallidiluteum]
MSFKTGPLPSARLAGRMRSALADIGVIVTAIPSQVCIQLKGNRTRLFASILTMNLLWAAWMVLVERFVVGMSWTAMAELRFSAMLWNTLAAVVWTGHMEQGLSAVWHRASGRRSPLRWYWTALAVSLISQVPVQAAAYMPPILWGDARWEEVRWSWGLALLFSPVIGIHFSRIHSGIETLLDRVLGLRRQPGWS